VVEVDGDASGEHVGVSDLQPLVTGASLSIT
jgi:hypothetical protein